LFLHQYRSHLTNLISFSLGALRLQSNSFPHARLDDVTATTMTLLEALVLEQPNEIVKIDIAV
jgi:hypothetical protein